MSNEIPPVVTGCDTSIVVTWKVNGVPIPIAADSVVKARLVSSDYLTVYTPVLTLSNAAIGADWGNGVIAVEIPGTETVDLEGLGYAAIQLKVTPNGGLSKPCFFTVRVIKGNIP